VRHHLTAAAAARMTAASSLPRDCIGTWRVDMLCWRRAKAADKLTLSTPGLRTKGGLSEGAAAGISAFHVLRDLRSVVLEAAAERSAEEVVVDAGLLAREAGELHRLVSDLNG
jgi:hypothetical protein